MAKLNDDILAFIDRHNVDSVYYENGCETCSYGDLRTVNCSCGWDGEVEPYRAHLREMAEVWSPKKELGLR
jgi:hypothetical protein